MLTVALPDALENSVIAAASRTGKSVDEYLAAVFAEHLSLEQDRARFDAVVSGLPVVPHEVADQWLANLAEGKDLPCPR